MGQGEQYISLQEATEFCAYSQEYLSLRARQKKLKAVKLGRNWFTTAEWLSEYIGRAEGYKDTIKQRRKKETKDSEILAKEHVQVPGEDAKEEELPERTHEIPVPPDNLPFQEEEEQESSEEEIDVAPPVFAPARFAAAFTLVVALLFTAGIVEKDTIRVITGKLQRDVSLIAGGATGETSIFTHRKSFELSDVVGDVSDSALKSARELQSVVKFLGENFSGPAS